MSSKLFLLIMLFMHCLADDQLTQVLILSRHGVRTPLVDLDVYSPKPWLKWSQAPGTLTTKGALLEEYLGKYFADYLKKEKLLSDECLDNDAVHIYANSKHRTRKTAKHFVRTLFRGCDVTIHMQSNSTVDPLFLTVVLNDTEDFRTIALKVMQDTLKEYSFTDAYTKLNTILDIENSDLCTLNHICDLTKEDNNITLDFGQEPTIFGPFKAGYEVVDGLLMAYYNGELLSNIGWGQIQQEDWPVLMEIIRADQKVPFGCTEVAKYVAKPLLSYIKHIFMDTNYTITVLVGDHPNVNSVLASIGVKPYVLEGQQELSPIGGKVLFEKWYNGVDYYVKMKYIYLSTEQIRNGARISEDNPVREANLEIKDAVVNEQGHCTYEHFIKIIDNVLSDVPS